MVWRVDERVRMAGVDAAFGFPLSDSRRPLQRNPAVI